MGEALRAVGVLHPGNMGSAVAEAMTTSGATVLWASEGRSEQSRGRAEAAGLRDAGTLAAMAAEAEAIVSVCPPASAADVAEAVAAAGFRGTFVDANALSPTEMDAVARVASAAGASVVDGSIIGRPPTEAGATRIYLSGQGSPAIAALFGQSLFEAVVIGDRVGAASALKMSYAAFTKGSWALEACCLAVARHFGLSEHLAEEWERMRPGRMKEVEHDLRKAAAAAWRFDGEMRLVSQTFAALGLPEGFHEAATDVYRRLAGFKGQEPPADAVVESLLGRAGEATGAGGPAGGDAS